MERDPRTHDDGERSDETSDRLLFAPRELPPLRPDAGSDPDRYRQWTQERLARREPVTPRREPSVAIVLVVDDPDTARLAGSLRSATGQRSTPVELAVAVIGSLQPAAAAVLREAGVAHTTCPPGSDHATAAAAALERSSAPFALLLGQHDELKPDAVARLLGALPEGRIEDVAVYADEEHEGPDGRQAAPVLKPDWSPELHVSTPYVGRPLLVSRAVLAAVGGPRSVLDGDWEHDLALRTTERCTAVLHLAEVLYRRRAPSPNDGGSGAVVAALARAGARGDVEPAGWPGAWRVRRSVVGRPTVSVIVPFRDQPRFLRTCVDSVSATAGDLPFELVLVDNGSADPETLTLVDRIAHRRDVRILRDDRPFNWPALNNAAVRHATGEVLVFLNNDIEATTPGWLDRLAAQAQRPEVGAVGARLLYPDGRLQHAGMVIGLGGAAGHVLAGLPGDRPGYLGLAVLARECTAVTGACLATRRDVFDRLGGFDEQLGLDLNDVDYCLRAREAGLRVLYEPGAELVHYESPSRGTSGSATDIRRFVERWEDEILAGDPYLNRNLTRVDSSCALCGPDERGWWQTWRRNLPTS